MEFIRKIINSSELENLFDIPEDLRQQDVEVLILPIQQEINQSMEDFDPDNFKGVTHIDDLENELAAIRDEWDRL